MEPQSPVQPPEPAPASPPPRRWGLGDFVLGFFSGIALSTIATGIWFSITGDEELDLVGQAFGQLGLWTGMVGAALLASRRKGAGRLAEDFGFRARWVDLGIGVVVALVVQLLVLPGIALLLRPLLGEPDVSGPVQELVDKSRGLAYIGLVLSVAVGAPIVEELFFRGLLLRALQNRFSNGLAVILSAVAFGLAHGSTLPLDAVVLVMVSLMAFGAVLAILAIRTGRLGPGIVAHAVFNLFTILYLTFNG